ncbi:MAG TPA: FGGY family carbohydrate kinase [Roseiflexaceae bacterium]|nr:FGGY family carbohydrate kinase [Roseiflexaceae bacterium]
MQFLGIDLGTSFVKGAVLDLDTLQLGHIQRTPFPAAEPGLAPGRHELAPHVVVQVVRQMLETLLPHASACGGIVMCTQMHSVVLVNDAGLPITSIATWLDQRALDRHPSGGTFLDVLTARIEPQTRARLGGELRPGLPIATLFRQAAEHGLPAGAVPLAMADFALAQLCGAAPGVDPTNAAATGAMDVFSGDWSANALTATGLNILHWPAITSFTTPAGMYRSNGRELPCYRPVGDAQCALAGIGLAEGELSVNIATGSQVSLLQEKAALGDFQLRPFFDGRFLATISGIPAGRALNVLVGLLVELAAAHGVPIDDPWPYLLRAAEEAPDSELGVHLGFFGGAEGGQGAISHIRESNLSAGGLFRAAFRHMAASYRDAALRLAPDRAWERVVLSGGLARRSTLLRELIAAELKAPYRLGPAEDTLSGLLALALVCAGRAADVAEASALVRGHSQE